MTKRVMVTREDIINAALSPMLRFANVGEGMRFRAMVESMASTLMQMQEVPEWATHFARGLQVRVVELKGEQIGEILTVEQVEEIKK